MSAPPVPSLPDVARDLARQADELADHLGQAVDRVLAGDARRIARRLDDLADHLTDFDGPSS